MADRFATYKDRLRHALWIREGVTGEKLSQGRLAGLVGAEAKRTFSQPAAGAWLKGVMPRDNDAQLALSRVLSVGSVFVDPGWLFFGPTRSMAPAPMVPEELRGAEPTSKDPAPNVPIVEEVLPLPDASPQKRVAEAGRSYQGDPASRRQSPRKRRRPKR